MRIGNEDRDDRLERWMEVNGVTMIAPFAGDGRMHYFRADGSEVNPADSYPYDAILTPYTKVAGVA